MAPEDARTCTRPCHASSGVPWSATVQRLDFRPVGRSVCVRCPRRCAGRPPSVRRRARLRQRVPARAGARLAAAPAIWPAAPRASSRPGRAATVCRALRVGQSSARRPVACPRCRRGWRALLGHPREQPPDQGAARVGRKERGPGWRRTTQPARAAACRLDAPAQAQAPRSFSRRNWKPPDRGPSRQQQSMVLAGNSVKSHRPQERPSVVHRCGVAPAPHLLRCAAAARSEGDSPLRPLRLYSPPSLP
jgi:hypothetical protein